MSREPLELRVPRSALLAACAWLVTSCASEKMSLDPTLLVQSPSGAELGVSTDYGVVFLGHRSRAGEVSLTSWFGDGANVEASVVEPIGRGLYTAEVDIVLPWVRLTFETPRVGRKVSIMGRKDGEVWTDRLRVASHPSVPSGILLEADDADFAEDATQLGAGVFVKGSDGYPRLLGLVSGRLELTVAGQTSRYLTVVGPQDLWRLVVHKREAPFRKRWIYRGDVL